MTQEKQGERAKWLSFWRKVVIAAIGCIAVVGVGVMLWEVTHKESEEARMRRLVEHLAAREKPTYDLWMRSCTAPTDATKPDGRFWPKGNGRFRS